MVLNVLVADDSQVMRAMVIRTLRLSGLPLGEVYQAADGAEGWEHLERHTIDLAMLDLNMPVLSGEHLVARVREHPATRALPIVIVSSEGSSTRIERLRAQGVAFIRKPFTPEQLGTTVRELTGLGDEQLDRPLAASGGDLDF